MQLQSKKKFLKKVATSLANVDVLFAFVDSVMITNGAFLPKASGLPTLSAEL